MPKFMKNDKRNHHYPHHEFMMRLVVGDGIESVDEAVERLLLALGFKSKLVGTTYLNEAIKLWYSFPGTRRVTMSTDIYPLIATKLNSTVDRVERAIRNAIINCYYHAKLIWFNDLVQSDVVSATYAPTNAEFLSSVVNWLRIQSREHGRQLSFLQYVD